MEENKRIQLSNKLHQIQLKLQAREFVKSKISYHWLEIFDEIKAAKIECHIDYLCIVSDESYTYFIDAIKELKRPEFSTSLVRTNEAGMMDRIFEIYPTIDSFKYIMNLPVLSSCESDFNSIIQLSNQLPYFDGEPVYFLSPDWSPLIRLNWKDVMEKGGDVFNGIPLPYIFINSSLTKILFKSLEDEWRVLDGRS